MKKGESRKSASFDVLKKIEIEKQKRGWTDYQLAQNAEINQSILSTWKQRQIEPSLASIEQICKAFGISLAQFFTEDEECVALTVEQRRMLNAWNSFPSDKREALTELMEKLSDKQ